MSAEHLTPEDLEGVTAVSPEAYKEAVKRARFSLAWALGYCSLTYFAFRYQFPLTVGGRS